MRRLRAVIFDLDDTLYPEREFVNSGFEAVAEWVEEKFGFSSKLVAKEFYHIFQEGMRRNVFNKWLEDRGLGEEWVPHMVQVYREHFPRISPYPEVRDVLARLSRDYKLGIVTDGYLEVQKRKLHSLNIGHFFNAVIFSDALGKEAWKPSSHPFQAVLGELSICGFEAVYVGDNPQKDFLGAKRLGMHTIRVRRPDGLYSHLEPLSFEYAPDIEVKTLYEVLEVLL